VDIVPRAISCIEVQTHRLNPPRSLRFQSGVIILKTFGCYTLSKNFNPWFGVAGQPMGASFIISRTEKILLYIACSVDPIARSQVTFPRNCNPITALLRLYYWLLKIGHRRQAWRNLPCSAWFCCGGEYASRVLQTINLWTCTTRLWESVEMPYGPGRSELPFVRLPVPARVPNTRLVRLQKWRRSPLA